MNIQLRWSCGTAAVFCLFTIAAAQARGQSFTDQTVAIGIWPNMVRFGDYNHDGNADLIIADRSSALGSMKLANGTGGFGTEYNYTIGAPHFAVAIADLNTDGKLDLVATKGTAASNVSVLLGNGDGTFAPGNIYSAGGICYSVAIGDLNSDGRPDIALANYSVQLSSASVLFANGTGGFASPVKFTTGAFSFSIALADFNFDGQLDMVTANKDANNVSVLIASTPGAFSPAVNLSVGALPTCLTVGDFNADGAADIVTCNSNSNNISLLAGDGAGNFSGASNTSIHAQPSSIGCGDVNSDGNLDLLTAHRNLGETLMILGDGFGAFPTLIAHGPVVQPDGLVITDINSDGRLDAAVANTNIQSFIVTLMIQQAPVIAGVSLFGSGTFGCHGKLAMQANTTPQVGAADFAFICTNAPKNSLGLAVASDVPDLAGSDPFGIGVLLYADLLNGSSVIGVDILSDASGVGYLASPLGPDPSLAGLVFYLQCVWLENVVDGQACSQSWLHLVSSNGLMLTIQQ